MIKLIKFAPTKFQIISTAAMQKLNISKDDQDFMSDVFRRIGMNDFQRFLGVLNIKVEKQDLDDAKEVLREKYKKGFCSQCGEWGANPDGRFTTCFECFLRDQRVSFATFGPDIMDEYWRLSPEDRLKLSQIFHEKE